MPTLSPEVLAALQKLQAGQTANIGGNSYLAYNGIGQHTGGEGGDYTPGDLMYGQMGGDWSPNQAYSQFDQSGNYAGQGQSGGKPDFIQNMLAKGMPLALLAAGGAAAGMFGGSAGGAGADTVSNLVGSEGLDTAAVPSTFNAAADSQLANQGIAAAGGNPLAGYAAAGATPSAVTLANTGQLLGPAAAVPSVFKSAIDSASANAGPTDPNAPTGVNGSSVGAASSLSSLSDLFKSNPWLAPLLGGIAGSQPTTTSKKTVAAMDPRMDAMVYGANGSPGLLGNASAWYDANKSGMNPTMRAAQDARVGLLSDPATAQGFKNAMGVGQGLLSRPMAGNPYTNGNMPQFGSNYLGSLLGRRAG